MQFRISPDVFASFPGVRVIVMIARDLDNRSSHPDIEFEWQQAWKAAAELNIANAQSHPRVKAWRDRFTSNGISGKHFPSSIEAMLRRGLKGGSPFLINPLVDFYNTISLRHTVPAGGFDLDQIGDTLDLRLSVSGDEFSALGEEEIIAVPAGEVSYAAGRTILTRHFVWRQSRYGLINESTRNAILVSEILPELGADLAERVKTDFQKGLEVFFHIRSQTHVMDEHHPEIFV